MTPDEIDRTGLIREAYSIPGIGPEECRSIFLDWALKLPAGTDQPAAIRLMLATYGLPGHPMTEVLAQGLLPAPDAVRRGGRTGRVTRP